MKCTFSQYLFRTLEISNHVEYMCTDKHGTLPFNLSLLLALLDHFDVKVISPVDAGSVAQVSPTHHQMCDITILLHCRGMVTKLQTARPRTPHTPTISICHVYITIQGWIMCLRSMYTDRA